MSKKLLTIKKILMMMLCIIALLLSTVSCTKDELSFDNNQTDNLTDVQDKIGKKENMYEKFENIESYKNFQFESDLEYQKHQKFLDKIKTYQEFPNQRKSLEELAKEYGLTSLRYYHYLFEIYKFEIYKLSDYNIFETIESKKNFTDFHISHLINDYQREKDREVYVEVFCHFDEREGKYYYYSPGEAYKFTYEERVKYRNNYYDWENKRNYYTEYFTVDTYSKISGIPKEEITNLRIITVNDNQKFERKTELISDYSERTLYLYQFSFVDNYKDYRNDSKFFYSFDKHRLKKYIKPGSCIFVFDQTFDKLDNHDISLFGSFGHMMIVSDYYQETMSNQYLDLDQYKKLEKNQEFVEIDALRRDMYDSSVSFEDYLKHFVFIEAYLTSQDRENNKLYFDKRKGVIFSSGNDRIVQNNFRNKYTIIAISNLNKGIKMYNTEIQHLFLNYIRDAAIHNRSYDYSPDLNENKNSSYCSGLVYFGYKRDDIYGIKILNENLYTKTRIGDWYMPRTITNSPFMYTRIWYKYDYKNPCDY